MGYSRITYTPTFKKETFKDRSNEVKIQLCLNRIKRLEKYIEDCKLEIDNIKRYMKSRLDYDNKIKV